jgi:hypothetical protein
VAVELPLPRQEVVHGGRWSRKARRSRGALPSSLAPAFRSIRSSTTSSGARPLDELLEQFPTVSRDQAVAILEAAKEEMLTQAAGM